MLNYQRVGVKYSDSILMIFWRLWAIVWIHATMGNRGNRSRVRFSPPTAVLFSCLWIIHSQLIGTHSRNSILTWTPKWPNPIGNRLPDPIFRSSMLNLGRVTRRVLAETCSDLWQTHPLPATGMFVCCCIVCWESDAPMRKLFVHEEN